MGQGRKGQDTTQFASLCLALPTPAFSVDKGPSLRLYARDQSYKQIQPQSSVPVGGPCLGEILRGLLGTGRIGVPSAKRSTASHLFAHLGSIIRLAKAVLQCYCVKPRPTAATTQICSSIPIISPPHASAVITEALIDYKAD
ncbi:hypothetical protein TRIATDRAFT_86039 [Trichoderma atroviride IMI 206040]|uniref:Uncharacterized protein n=1 Tax=Hypocrea atroviridis (strain ATCC 20476 / IMI 206040) TaxID=452589 RepID=G9P0D5_HYPAI|nr:uncharacterized protein TRIATDRAFT_86039 [Trichoderma atroviride IMI 206040]EHK43126.1 hypothetical protein TRIATDRAFT_86039 [Trichoderma atroviride IMI 206040]